jgi:hypothetical protein
MSKPIGHTENKPEPCSPAQRFRPLCRANHYVAALRARARVCLPGGPKVGVKGFAKTQMPSQAESLAGTLFLLLPLPGSNFRHRLARISLASTSVLK